MSRTVGQPKPGAVAAPPHMSSESLTQTVAADAGLGQPGEVHEKSLGASAQTVVRNFASLLLGRFGSQVIGFATNAYLARRIAPSGFGAVGLAQSVVSYLSLMSDSGLSVIAVREGAQNPSGLSGLIGSITGLRLALSCALLPFGFLAAQFLPFSEASRDVLRVFALSLPLQALAVDWVFRALQRMQYAAITQLATAALTLALTVSFVRSPQHLLRVPWLGLATSAAAFALSLYLLARTGHRFSVSFRLSRSKKYLVQSLPLCGASFAVTLYLQANYLILGKVHGDAEVGMYVAASKIAGVVFTVTTLYFSAMAPAMMALYVRSREDAATLLTESVRLTAAAGCGLAAMGAVGSGLILTGVFGPAFSPAQPALALLLCSGGVLAVTQNWCVLAIAAQRERLVLWATALGGVTNLIVCGALVRRYASVGAAIGNLAAETVAAAVLVLAWPRELGIGPLRVAGIPAALAVIAVLAGALLMPFGHLSAFCAAPAIYALGLLVTRTVTIRDIRRLWSAFRIPDPRNYEPLPAQE